MPVWLYRACTSTGCSRRSSKLMTGSLAALHCLLPSRSLVTLTLHSTSTPYLRHYTFPRFQLVRCRTKVLSPYHYPSVTINKGGRASLLRQIVPLSLAVVYLNPCQKFYPFSLFSYIYKLAFLAPSVTAPLSFNLISRIDLHLSRNCPIVPTHRNGTR